VSYYYPYWVVPMPGQPGYIGDMPPEYPYGPVVPVAPWYWPPYWPYTTKIVVTNGTQP
jgi:hypothetical protein